MIFVSSCPARPTNGIALHVLVARPAPRRRTSDRAFGLPTPKTICRRPERVQLAARAVADVGRGRRRAPRSAELAPAPSARRRTAPSTVRRSLATRPTSAGIAARRPRHAASSGDASDAGRRRARGSPTMLPAGRRSCACAAARRRTRARAGVRRGRGSRAATSALRCSGTRFRRRRPPTSVTALVVDVEAGVGARHVVGDDQVDVLAPRACAARARTTSSVSAAKPTSSGPRPARDARRRRGRRGCPASAAARSVSVVAVLRDLLRGAVGRRVVGDGRRHDDDVDGGRARARPRRASRRRCARARRRRTGGGSTAVGPATSVTVGAAPRGLGGDARSPCGRSTGCR